MSWAPWAIILSGTPSPTRSKSTWLSPVAMQGRPWHWIAPPMIDWAKAPPLPTTSARSTTASVSPTIAMLLFLGIVTFLLSALVGGGWVPLLTPSTLQANRHRRAAHPTRGTFLGERVVLDVPYRALFTQRHSVSKSMPTKL